MPVRMEGAGGAHDGCVAIQHALCQRVMIFEMDPSATMLQRRAIIAQVKDWMAETEDDPDALRIVAVVCDAGTSVVDVVTSGSGRAIALADQVEASFRDAMEQMLYGDDED